MDDAHCQSYFLEPTETLHRRYEVLRAFFSERLSFDGSAEKFGLASNTVRSLVRDFRTARQAGQVSPFLHNPVWDDPSATEPSPNALDPKLLPSPTVAN